MINNKRHAQGAAIFIEISRKSIKLNSFSGNDGESEPILFAAIDPSILPGLGIDDSCMTIQYKEESGHYMNRLPAIIPLTADTNDD